MTFPLAAVLFAAVAGHDLRLLGPRLALRPGETAVLRPAFSHGEDDGVDVPPEDLVQAMVKDGTDTAAPAATRPGEPSRLKVAPRREGIVQAFVETKPRITTKVVERDGRHGHRNADKLAVKDAAVVSSTRGRRLAKAIVVAGEPREAAAPCGLALEIVPLDPPRDWHPGVPLRFRVLAAGKAVAGIKLEAGAEGASLGDGEEFPLAATTDAAGEAALALPDPGLWTLRAERVAPAAAADLPRFDTERTVATLSLEIRRRPQ